ncbi:MAG: nicotinate phosphoribosyltransferase [Clostridia bacterium]|nr:nicotinate phosphoribosyltransferase [Clostridia bacterium]MBR2414167.1 nicotinate phosphoribosyltransferase [Clostridia bacterium]MBR3954341.1 nicotinate phosphoribosyltransferase [Clostridia bacterium]
MPENNFCDFLFDFYELAQANGFLAEGIDETIAWFDVYFRPAKELGGFFIAAGIESVCEKLSRLHFSEEELAFLQKKGLDEAFIAYLRNFSFSCDIWAVPEGTPVFANEPVVKIRGPVIQAQMLETILLLNLNHQTLVATKANRLVRSAQGREVIEFGLRKAHGADAAASGARAAYIAGFTATSNVDASFRHAIPSFTSMSPTWVQLFENEKDAFAAFAKRYPDDCVLLIDTYDCIDSGLPNAIAVFDEVLAPMGKRPKGVRIESGDLAYLSKKIRRILNEAGYPDCNIYASNSLDEYIIRDMLQNGARVDAFLAGKRLLTAAQAPVMGGIFSLSAIETDGKVVPKIKISENVAKISTPCPKLLWRLFDNETGKAIADLLTMEDEDISTCKEYELFDPDYVWKRKTVSGFVARKLLVPYFVGGKDVHKKKTPDEIRAYCMEQIDSLWEEVVRFEYPHNYYVDLSQKLWDCKQKLIDDYYNGKK